MSESKEFYRQQLKKDAPLFHQPWWLDAICGNNWDAVVLKDGDDMRAYFIYSFLKTKLGLRLVMPPLTQFLGPGYHLVGENIRERNNEETELLEQLLKQLPPFASFESRWQLEFQNWLPFHWKHFHQRNRYTYRFENITAPELLRRNFSEKINREINKGEKLFTIEEAEDVEKFYKLLVTNFKNKGVKVSLNKNVLQSVFNAAKENNAGKIFLAKDSDDKIASGIFIAWDATAAYYIIGGKEETSGNTGAMSYLFWTALNDLKQVVDSFDFEGSMIRGVEQYFRSFGAERKSFFEITRTDSPLLKLKNVAKNILQRP